MMRSIDQRSWVCVNSTALDVSEVLDSLGGPSKALNNHKRFFMKRH